MKVTEGKIEKALKNSGIKPDKSWQTSTRNRLEILQNQDSLVNSAPKNNIFFNLFSMKKKQFVLLSGFVFIFIVLGGTTFIYQGLFRNIGQNANFSEAQKQSILENIIKNNAQGVIAKANELATAGDNDSSTGGDKPTAPAIIPEIFTENKNKFRLTKTFVKKGTAECKSFGIYTDSVIRTEVYEFTDKNGNYYNKQIEYDQNNNLINYSLTTTVNNKYEVIYFRNGKYAVKNVNTYSGRDGQTEPGSTTGASQGSGSPVVEGSEGDVDPQNDLMAPTQTTPDVPEPERKGKLQIEDYFGQNSKVTKLTENGRELLNIENSYDIDCNAKAIARSAVDAQEGSGASTTASTNKIVYVNKVDAKTYEVLSTSYYKNTVSEQNLIYSFTTETTSKESEFSAVSKDFKFEFNVPVKTINSEGSVSYDIEKETKEGLKNVRNNNVSLILPSDFASRLKQFYVNNEMFKTIDLSDPINYSRDRNFYMTGSVGDEIFKKNNPETIHNSQVGYYAFTTSKNTEEQILINIYKKNKSNDELIRNDYFTISDLKNRNVNVKIGDQSFTATLYEYTTEFGTKIVDQGANEMIAIAPDRPDCNGEDCKVKVYKLIVQIGEYKYIISEGARNATFSETKFNNLKLIFPDLSNQTVYKSIEKTILNNNTKPIPVDDVESGPTTTDESRR